MAAYVLSRAVVTPDKVALSVLGATGSQDWTYDQLERAVLGTAAGLRELGLSPGARILMRLGNCVAFPIAYLAAIAAGFVPVPTSAQLTLSEVDVILKDLAPEVVLCAKGVASPAHPNILTLDGLQALQDTPYLPDHPYEMGDPNRLAYIIYTSGTSGKPRAVAHAHRAIWARRMMIDDWCDLGVDDRILHAGAFNWTYTLGTGLMDPWTVGATALIPQDGTEIADLPRLLARHKATIFAAAPGVYRKLVQHGNLGKIPSLRHGLSAGEKLPQRVTAAWNATTGTQIYEAYGMSECSTFVSASPRHPAPYPATGRPQIGRRVAIVDDAGPVAMGTEGTIAVHRDDCGLMLGYLNAPADTAARMQSDWFLTGDRGTMDQRGNITFLGRDDDMMNAGGYRVSPIEVEAALADFPGLEALGVTDVQARQDARIIAAFYTSQSRLDEAALQRYAQTKLARYKQPRAYIHLPALPVGANGKVLRRALRGLFEAKDDQA